jgi:probable F420-dependent oxidoreductase
VPTMRSYLDRMDSAPFFAVKPSSNPTRVLAALGPRMLALAKEHADGAHPYNVTPEHTAMARGVLGADKLLAVEQKAVLTTDMDEARAVARKAMAVYLSLPNYVNNWKRLGFTDDDFADGGSDRLLDAMVVSGNEGAVRQRVKAHLDAGADHVCVQVLSVESRAAVPLDEWRRLAPVLAV